MEGKDLFVYLNSFQSDENWGMMCTTVGFQNIGRGCSYPLSSHPSDYCFSESGRVLDEYQLVYITSGNGYFQSTSVPLQQVAKGTIIVLFPGEKHRYYPDSSFGWNELWVGFKGRNADALVGKFFSSQTPLLEVGERDNIAALYKQIIDVAKQNQQGSQQLICGIISHLLGLVYYEHINYENKSLKHIEQINHVRMVLSNNLSADISYEELAKQQGMSYSSLRNCFKQITGVSMQAFRQQQRLARTKELLASSDKSISEIAYEAGFESVSRFCSFFRSQMGISAGAFRSKYLR